jgi:tetratricopeptide (TPR) repeat protein
MRHLAFTLLFLGMMSSMAQDSPQDLMRKAIEAQQAGSLDLAIRDYRQLLERYPDIFEIRSNLGAALAGEGKYTDAIEEYRRALSLKPSSQVRLNLALAYYKIDDLPEAVANLKLVHAELPDDLQTIELLADCYLKQGRNKEAIALLAPVHDREADNDALTYLLGTALLRDGQVPLGQKIIDRILRDPDSAVSRMLMGTAKYAAGDYPGARDDFRKAVESNPKLPDAYAYYGVALLYSGDRAQARKAFENELELDASDFTANLYLGVLSGENRDYAGAMEYFHRALATRPHDPGTRFEAASIELQQGELAEATRDLESLVKDTPDFSEAHWALAGAYLKANRTAEGRRERAIAGRLAEARDQYSVKPIP